MRRPHRGGARKTLNIKRYRLIATFPGGRMERHTDASMKVLRPLATSLVAAGARVEMQEHTGFERYRTVRVYEPQGVGR